jgi:iron(III) transport system permease protein
VIVAAKLSIRDRPASLWKSGQGLGTVATGNGALALVAWLTIGAILGLGLVVLWVTFTAAFPGEGGLTLANFATVASKANLADVVLNTILIGILTTIIAVLFALPLAWFVHRTDMPFKGLMTTLVALGIVVPGFLKAIGWVVILSSQVGLLNVALRQLFNLETSPLPIEGIGGIAFVQALMLTPTVFFLISGPMRSMDPALEESAEVAGASRALTTLRVTLPLLWPGILAGIIYTFMTAVSIYEVPALLGAGRVPVMTTELFFYVNPSAGLPRYGVAGVMGLMMIIPSVFALALYFRTIRESHRFAVVTGRGYRPKLLELGFWRYSGLLLGLLFVMLGTGLPFLALVWTSLLPSLRMPSPEALQLLTLNNYAKLWVNLGGQKVLSNTLVLLVSVSLLSVAVSFVVSWVVVRTRMPGRQVIDTVAMLPHAIPGIAFAFALAIVGLLGSAWLGLSFQGTIAIIVVANTLHLLSYTTRVTNAALLQVGTELEEAAYVSGAKKLWTIWAVMLPLVRPSLVFAGLWSGLLAFREVTMALLLYVPQNEVLAVRVWMTWTGGRQAEASSLGVVVFLVMTLLIFLLQRTTGLRVAEERR